MIINAKYPTQMFNRKHGNGLDLTLSVNRPNSRLCRVLRFLRDNGPSTKLQILTALYPGKAFSLNGNPVWHNVPGGGVVTGPSYNTYATRSYQSAMFMVAVADGFLSWRRVGNKVLWNRGPNAHFVNL
jgi:hypothetical protein